MEICAPVPSNLCQYNNKSRLRAIDDGHMVRVRLKQRELGGMPACLTVCLQQRDSRLQ